MITPNDHISHDLSYICGPRTSGAATLRGICKERIITYKAAIDLIHNDDHGGKELERELQRQAKPPQRKDV